VVLIEGPADVVPFTRDGAAHRGEDVKCMTTDPGRD
jgi:hypothetical protein